MADKLTDKQKELFDDLTKMQQKIVLKSLEGMNDIDAYRAGGGKAKDEITQAVSASQIFSNLKVVSFMDSMKETLISEAIMTRTEALERLTRIARADCVPVFKSISIVDAEGNEHKQTVWSIPDSEDLTPEQLSSIAEVSTGKDGLKIKQHSAPQAIKQLAEMEDWNKQKDEGKGEIHIHINGKAALL